MKYVLLANIYVYRMKIKLKNFKTKKIKEKHEIRIHHLDFYKKAGQWISIGSSTDYFSFNLQRYLNKKR